MSLIRTRYELRKLRNNYIIKHMHLAIEPLLRAIANLDKKAEEIDEAVRNLRLQIHTIFWDLVEMRKAKAQKKI